MPKISVSSRMKGGHRRAGKFIPDSQIEITVTDEELKRIQADGQIVCVVHEDEPAPAEPPKPPAPTVESKPVDPKAKK